MAVDESSTYRNLNVAQPDYNEALNKVLDGSLTGQVQYKLATMGDQEFWGTETDLDENAYGAAAVAIVKDTTKLAQQIKDKVPMRGVALTLARLGMSLGLMIVNLVFQALILWYIYIFVVQPSVRHVQVLYAEFHAYNFDEHGGLIEGAWESYSNKMGVCQVTMSSRTFYYGILTLWALLMMMELRSCHRVALDIWRLRRVESMKEVLDYPSTQNYELGGRCLIVGLTPTMRAAVMGIVCLPRFLIGISLFGLGCQWLSSAASFADMTLNAMALEFVKNIDEILYESILPRQLKTAIADTNLFTIEKQKTLKDVNNAEWTGYKRTLCWVVTMGGFLFIYGTCIQTVLPYDLSELQELCAEVVKKSHTPVCTDWTWSGWSESCYPYGKGSGR